MSLESEYIRRVNLALSKARELCAYLKRENKRLLRRVTELEIELNRIDQSKSEPEKQ